MAKADRLFRYIEIDSAKIDRTARTVPLSFSSEFPAMQRADGSAVQTSAGLKSGDVYIEILDHAPENVDLSLLNNRGAFLDEHDDKDQLGVVEKAEVADKHGRAVVKLSSHDKAMRRFEEMAANERPHISAGYKYTRFLGEETLPNGRKAKRFAWRALELSSVAVPADPTIGVARAYQDLPEVDSSTETKSETPKDKFMADKDTVVIDETKVRADEREKTRGSVLADERKRTKEIGVIADALIKDHGKKDGGKLAEKIRSMASDAIAKDESVSDFKIRCMTDVLAAKPATPTMLEDCTDEAGQRDYSLLRGIQSCIKRDAKVPDGLEGEVHQEIIRRSSSDGGLGYPAQGFQVPANAPLRGVRAGRVRMQRDMQATIFNAGGAAVPTNLIVPIIELLRNRMVLDRVGIRTMAGLHGNILIPRQEGAATAYSVAEIQQLTASQQILGQIALSPKRVGATETYSKQFVMQSSPDAEAFIQDDLFKVLALKWDYLGLNGQGANSEPLGVMNTPGIGGIVFGATPTYAKIVAMETALRDANVEDELCYVSTPKTKGSLKTVAEALTGATTIGGASNALWKAANEMNGYPAIASKQVPNDQVILGAWSHLIHAIWGGLDVVIDTITLADKAEIKISINTWGDFVVRHAQAFCVSADSGAQ